ncbi:MAG: DNRLRE domain-containing protein [Pirellulales bacterium]
MIDRNPGLPTIVTTHSYLNPSSKIRQAEIQDKRGDVPNVGNTGEQVFQKLIAVNDQIFLVMNGHFSGEYHQTSINAYGNAVFEMVVDYQSRANGGDGWMRLLEFRPDEQRIAVQTYSPTLNRFETDANSAFNFSLNFTTRFGAPAAAGTVTSTYRDGLVVDGATYAGTVDTQIKQSAPTTAYGTSSAQLFVDDASPGEANASQALLRFQNLIGYQVGQIPYGAKILDARLTLNSTDPGAGASLHRMMRTWSDDSTWNSLGDGLQNDNRDAAKIADARIGTPGGTSDVPGAGRLTINVTDDVQLWADGAENFGWALLPWSGGTNGWGFSPSEAAFDLRPTLVIECIMSPSTVTTFRQDKAGYVGAADTVIRPASPNTRRDKDESLWVDGPKDDGTAQTLLRFDDLFGNRAGLIPADATIESARLYLTTQSTVNNAAGDGAKLFRLTRAWTATTTWGNTFGGDGVQPGGEAISSPDRIVGSIATGTYGFDVTAALKAWQAGAANHGWALTANGDDGWAFASSENAAHGERPKLVVVWSKPRATTLLVGSPPTSTPSESTVTPLSNPAASGASIVATVPVRVEPTASTASPTFAVPLTPIASATSPKVHTVSARATIFADASQDALRRAFDVHAAAIGALWEDDDSSASNQSPTRSSRLR